MKIGAYFIAHLASLVVAQEDFASPLDFDDTEPETVEAPDDDPITELGVVIHEKGTGELASNGHEVLVKYEGRLTNGKVFDGGEIPFMLGAGQVIPGWDRGVLGMRVGEKRELKIPPHLAYGQRGSPPQIPPNAPLIFDVELLGVTPSLPTSHPELDPNSYKIPAVNATIIEPGEGKPVAEGDEVTIGYEGKLASNNKVFDVGEVKTTIGSQELIPGFEAGIEGMRPGEKRKLEIPWQSAYGDVGFPEINIPPEADLKFTVELKDGGSQPEEEDDQEAGEGPEEEDDQEAGEGPEDEEPGEVEVQEAEY